MTSLNLTQVLRCKNEQSFDSEYTWQITTPPITHTPREFQAKELYEHKAIFKHAPDLGTSIPWDGNYDTLADTLERSSREKYIAADKAYFKQTGEHLDINEGSTSEGNARRSCSRQAELWMRYNVFKFPGAAKAHRPGCSHHNYGMAVDLKSYNDTVKEVLTSNGWTDEYPGEKWHFTCTGSEIFDVVQKTITELKAGKAHIWRQDTVTAFNLNRDKNTLHAALGKRAAKFEGDANAFNAQAKRFNDAKQAFHDQTVPHAMRREDLFRRMHIIDQKTAQLEQAYTAVRESTDEIVAILEKRIEEIRRLLALPIEDLENIITPQIHKVPQTLKAKYSQSIATFKSLKTSLATETRALATLIITFNPTLGDFEQKARELTSEYNFLRDLRQKLEAEKHSIERGYVDVQLMARESMLRLTNSSRLLEEIQAIVDAVSPS